MLSKIKNLTKRTIRKVKYAGINLMPECQVWFLKYFFEKKQQKFLINSGDPVRFGAVLLAIQDIQKNHIKGAFAEAGVYQGFLSKFIHDHAPDRKLYLFDTFEGFPSQNLKNGPDNRFKDTSIEIIKKRLGNMDNVIIKKGFFPESAKDLKNQEFAFAMLDFDLYDSILAALEFFYPRMTNGGYIFLHDYHSPESESGVSRATEEFMKDKKEKIVGIPDACGSVIIRKIC